jgi:hypothetical protein
MADTEWKDPYVVPKDSKDTEWKDPYAPPEPPSVTGELGKTVMRGIGGIGQMGGHILKVAGATDTGTALDEASDRLSEKYAMHPDVAQSFVKRGVLGGIESMFPSVAAGAPGAIIGAKLGSMAGPGGALVGGVGGGIIGYALSGGAMMGIAEYQNYLDEHKKEFGVEPDSDVKANARLSGLAEGGFEMLSDFVGGKLVFGGARRAAATSIKDILRRPLDKALGDYAKIMATETGSEMATAAVQSKARQNTGIPTAGMGESAAEAIIPSMVMSSMFMAGGIGLKKLRNNRIESNLQNPEANPEERLRAAMDVNEVIKESFIDPATGKISQLGVDTSAAWEKYAVNAIAQGAPVKLDLMLDPMALQIESALDEDPEGKKAVTPVSYGGIGGMHQDVEGGAVTGKAKLPPPIDFGGGIGGVQQDTGTGAEALGGLGAGKPPPAPTITPRAQSIFERLYAGADANTGDLRLDKIINEAHAKEAFDHPKEVQGILDDYEAGMYPDEEAEARKKADAALAEEARKKAEADAVTAAEEARKKAEAEKQLPERIRLLAEKSWQDRLLEGESGTGKEYSPEEQALAESHQKEIQAEWARMDAEEERKKLEGEKPPGETGPVSPVPPPVNGKRNWYEFTDPDFPMADRTPEEKMRMLRGEGATPEEQAAYDQWIKERQVGAGKVQAGETQKTEEGKAKADEIMQRVKRKWAENNPDVPLVEVAGRIAEIRRSLGENIKASSFISAFTSDMGIENRYDFIGKILDKLGVNIELTDYGTASYGAGGTGEIHEGGYRYKVDAQGNLVDGPGRIVLAHRAMTQAMDHGEGYGTAHVVEIFVHEALHAIVKHSPNWKQSKSRLEAFRNTLIQHQDSAPESVKDYLKHSDRNDISELISEALSDAKFAQWLDSIPAAGVKNQSKTMWGQLKDIIFRALETFGLSKTKLDELNEILDEVMAVSPEGEYGAAKQEEKPAGQKDKLPTPDAPPGWDKMTLGAKAVTFYVSTGGRYQISVLHDEGVYRLLTLGEGEKDFKTLNEAIKAAEVGKIEEPGKTEEKPPEEKPPDMETFVHPVYGSLQKPLTAALSKAFLTKIQETADNFDKNSIKNMVAEIYGTTSAELTRLDRLGKYSHKGIEEAFEYALVQRAREIINTSKPETVLGQLITLYNRQANLATRTSTSTSLQQYSTPAPIAWIMNKFLNMTGNKSRVSVYEPTAGNGMLLMGANPSRVSANELDKGYRAENLKDFLPGAAVTSQDAQTVVASPGLETVDRVIANPPFGSHDGKAIDGYKLTKLEHVIIGLAMGAMKNNGKASFIIGGHNARFDRLGNNIGGVRMTLPDRIFMNWLYNNYNVTHNIDVNGDLYARQGTQFPIRVITVDGRKAEPGEGNAEYTNIEPANTFQELNDILERGVKNEAQEQAGAEGRPGTQEAGHGPDVPGRLPGGLAGEGGGTPGGRGGAGGNIPGVPQGTGVGGGADVEGGAGPEGTPPGQPGETPEGAGGVVGRPDLSVGEPGVGGGLVQTGESGRTGGNITSTKEDIEKKLNEMEIPDFSPTERMDFMPFEKAEEEKFYQEKMKPVLDDYAREIVSEEGADITDSTFMQRIGSKVKNNLEKMFKYIERWLAEEFPALMETMKSAGIFQTAYGPVSKGRTDGTMVPRNQAQAIRAALLGIEREHGPIDEWVRSELGGPLSTSGMIVPFVSNLGTVGRKDIYKNLEELYDAFSAEQIDALALTISNMGNYAGMILGDQTGVGKGRVCAGIIRWANKKGKIPIFVTDNANLFSDMYRDLLGINYPIRPFIMNDKDADIIDQKTGERIMNAWEDGKGVEAITGEGSGKRVNWGAITENPAEYLRRNNFSVVFTTYSQHNQGHFKNQDTLLDRLGPENYFILDESHKAAGDASGGVSNTRRKFTHFLAQASGVLYSSATFAKTPHNMAIYFRTALGNTGMALHELVDAIQQGGNPLQEYISNALAKVGQYVRRELDFAGINFLSTPTMANLSKNDPAYDQKLAELQTQYEADKKASDDSNTVVRQIISFSRAMRDENQGLQELLRREFPALIASMPSGVQWNSESTNFASIVHNFNSQLLMGIKTQRTIEAARQSLAEGKKVIINVNNTMGAFLTDMVKMGLATVGEPIDFSYKGVLDRGIRNNFRIKIKMTAQGMPTRTSHITITPEQMQRYMPNSYGEYQRVRQLHGNYNVPGLHASPIDYMMSELSKISGKPVMELTGRDLMIDYNHPSGTPTLVSRKSKDAAGKKRYFNRKESVRLFNTGGSDVLIMNQSGSTGISLHSSPDFINKDGTPQKPRRMLLLQPSPDISVFMQALGRIFRKGQTLKPDYMYIATDLPADIRPNVILTRKMQSLKANTTSKQAGAESRADIPDMMNHHGDRIVREYLERNQAVMHRLGFHDTEGLTYGKVSGNITVLPVELQKEFYEAIEQDYRALIQELTDRGENDLISRDYDLKARTAVRTMIWRGLGATSTDAFNGPVFVEVVRARKLKRPYNTAKITKMVSDALGGKTSAQYSKDLFAEVLSKRDAYFNEWVLKLPDKYPGDAALQAGARAEKEAQLDQEIAIYRDLLNPESARVKGNSSRQMRLGAYYEIPFSLEERTNTKGVLIKIAWVPGTGNPLQPSKLKFTFAVPDSVQTRSYHAGQSWFREDKDFVQETIPNDWTDRLDHGDTEEKVLVTGNMVRGINAMGSISEKVHYEMVNFTRIDGRREFGLLIAPQDQARIGRLVEADLGQEVDHRGALDYLTDVRVEQERIISSRDGQIRIHLMVNKTGKGPTAVVTREYTVRVPGGQAGKKYYQDAELRKHIRGGEFRTQGDGMVANIEDGTNLMNFLEELDKQHRTRFVIPQEQVNAMPFEKSPEQGKATEEIQAMPFIPAIPWVNDLTDRFLNKPQDMPAEDLTNLKTFLKTQNDFKFKDEYLGLPWWNAKKYPAWRKAFEIFGIERPESRGAHMHSFAEIAEPFFKLDENMRKAKKSAAERIDAKERINRVIITGDALLGPQLKSLRQRVRTMEAGPEKDRINERIAQIERDNRYSDEQLLEGIKDDQGRKVKLSQEEIEVYKSVRKSLDFMFDTYVDHLQTQTFRRYKNQKWYAILAQAAGMDLGKTTTLRIVGSGLDKAAILRAVKIQPDINKIFDRVEKAITQTPDAEKMAAGELYGKLSERISEQLLSLEKALSTLTGEKDPKKLTDMTRAILSAYMFTRPQLKLIKALRNTYKKQVAFFPRVREQGKYKARLYEQIKDKEGMVIKERELHSEMFTTEAEGRKIYDKMLQRWGKDGALPENFHATFNAATTTPEFAFQGVNDINMQKVYDDAIESMKGKGQTIVDKKGEKIDVSEQLRQAGYMAIAKQFQSRGFGRHAIHRQWNVIKGYEENGLQNVLFNYMSGMSGIMTKQVAASDFLEMMKDVKEPALFKSLTKYGKDQLRNETSADKFSNKVRSMMFTWYLGGVLRPAVLQFTQNFVTGMPKHAQYLRENSLGGAGKADKDYAIAMKDVAFKNYTEIEKRMQEQLFTEGVTVDQYIREIMGSLGSRYSQEYMKFINFLAYPFSRMEQFNRQSAALTRFRPAYQLALKEGLSEEEAYEKAFSSSRDYVYDTHYAYGKANLPQIAQGEGVGIAVKTLYTFKSFTHNYCLAMYNDMAKGDWKTWMHSLAYLALFGGLMGLPFFKDLFEFIEKHFGYNFPGSIRKTLNSAGGKTLETFGMNGIPAMLGMNMSGSLAIGVPFMGETPQDTVYGVYGGQYQKMKRAGEAATRGDWYRFSANMAPEFARGPIVAAEESKIGKEVFGTPGVASTTRGRPVYDEQGKPLSMGTGEAIAKAAGFQPTEFARQKEKDQTVRRQEAWAAEAKTDAAETYRIARLNQKPDALKNMMNSVREINEGIRSRGIEKLVPMATVAKIIESSRQSKTKQAIREQRYKQGL